MIDKGMVEKERLDKSEGKDSFYFFFIFLGGFWFEQRVWGKK